MKVGGSDEPCEACVGIQLPSKSAKFVKPSAVKVSSTMDDVNPASPSETLEQQEVLRARIWEALENSPAPRVVFERHIPKNEGINVAISLDSFLELLYTSLAIEEDGIWGETAEIVADIFRVVKGGRLEEGGIREG